MQSIPENYDQTSGDHELVDPADNFEDTSSSNEDTEFPEEEIDITALYSITNEAQQAWTKVEVQHMMHHLKERGITSWIKEYVFTRNIPIPRLLHAFGITLCEGLQNKRHSTLLYFLKVAISRELRSRERLTQFNTVADAVDLIRSSRRILILTGAGISVSCGIPDFRSRDGLYASLKERGEHDLDDPQQMFDINYFRENPAVRFLVIFWSWVGDNIYPSNFVPSPCHRFIKLVEDKDQNYTQNIDTLETLAGVRRVLQCHGSFATASCLLCRRRVPGSEIEADILNRKVSLCTVCNPSNAAPPRKKKPGRKKAKGGWDSNDEDASDGPEYPPGIMKPDITFFGEKLTDDFDNSLAEDRESVDLLIVIGTSLKVSPVAEILSHLPHSVPQILINKTPVRHINPDIVLLGDADGIIQHICHELGWELPPSKADMNSVRAPLVSGEPNKNPSSSSPPERLGTSHIWLFDGAEGGKWVEDIREELERRGRSPPLTIVESENDIHYSTSPGNTAGRKREFLDVQGEERVLKRTKSNQGWLPSHEEGSSK
ncbi:DHS-like NAD/FAD-binding domain-containing protein [Collybia nuda]|uniref:DHS-like NAD/FAD-binding domain-containing protein n=1 Tax=Collybia nuda TaxID=64659 RepID=A0A9P5Y3L1_9AGAR|nr:DHS-like NAD/FAD-binding domain-containing protein [Collybia nuda]